MSPSALPMPVTNGIHPKKLNSLPNGNIAQTNSLTTTTDDYDPALFDPIESCIESFRNGSFLVVLDSPSRENEGDLIIAAEHITPSKMAFMIRHTSGIICTPLSPSICDALALPQMVSSTSNSDPNRTAYTVSVDSNDATVTTGISAYDRALTCNELARIDAAPTDFRRPGHVFPLRAREGGVRVRTGHTEAGVELCRLAGLRQASVISEIVDPGQDIPGVPEVSGGDSMLRRDGCVAFARKWGIKICTVEGLRDYVEENEGPWLEN